MDSRWSPLTGQSDRKRMYEQMQRPPSNDQQQHRFSSTFSHFLPHPRRSPLRHNISPNTFLENPFSFVDDMAERSRPRPSMRSGPYNAPRLQHRASQTVIDLTEDSDEMPSPPEERAPPAHLVLTPHRPRLQRPPRLGRDDILGADLIDLTNDSAYQSESDLELVGVQQRQPATPPAAQHARQHLNPRARFDHRRPVSSIPPQRPPQPQRRAPEYPGDLFLPHGPNDPYRPRLNPVQAQGFPAHLHRMMAALPAQHEIFGIPNAGAGRAMNMNYDAVAFAFGGGPAPPEPQKTPYVPPKPAEPGFTRSPAELKEDEIMICPACEEELVQHQVKDAPTTNARGKALTNKERAEHPFWVVRKCGHVYCNKCYQDRKNKNGDAKFYLPGQPKKDSTLICPVDDCTSAVSKPTEWIGIFL